MPRPATGKKTSGPTVAHYRVLRRCGSGGMAEVFEAQDEQLARRVALKLVPEESLTNPASIERFKREAQALAKFSHPNIVSVYGFGHDAGYHYIAMELVQGVPLSSILSQGPMPVPLALEWFRQMLDAVECIHAAGLVHRDIKPENFMIRADGVVKVIDFGIIKFLSGEHAPLTARGAVLGTLDFLAPELLRGAGASARSDIYALGILLYEMVTGGRVFGELDESQTLAAIRKGTIEPPSRRNPDVPASLDELILGMCANDPGARPQTAEEIRRSLGQAPPGAAPAPAPKPVSAGEPVLRRITRTFSSQSPASRARLLLLAACLIGSACALTLWRLLAHSS